MVGLMVERLLLQLLRLTKEPGALNTLRTERLPTATAEPVPLDTMNEQLWLLQCSNYS
jgi:hypothetical protein